jgi:ferredoxin--NADP+ reductase
VVLQDLIVVGAEPAGLAVAADAQRAGLGQVLVLASGDGPPPTDAVGRLGIQIRFDTTVQRIADGPKKSIVVESGSDSFLARACVVVAHPDHTGRPGYPIPDALTERVHFDKSDFEARDTDVLIVGEGERTVVLTLDLVAKGARPVVVFLSSLDDLSWLTRETLVALEHDRRATILWNSEPDSVEEVDGFPMAYFSDRRTPDLQFDHVVYSIPAPNQPTLEISDVSADREVVFVGDGGQAGVIHPDEAWSHLRTRCFPELPEPAVLSGPTDLDPGEADRLRLENYNATITHFDRAHNELWLIRIEPDSSDVSHLPGQYATLGMGYWEPRVDDAPEDLSPKQARRMIRRSYSISSRIFDSRGYLVDPGLESAIEFYIVHVKADGDKVPALTPRLAAKAEGDRIYIGPKIVGRYTLAPVDDPGLDVVFMATGTGEAPHNAMIAELLRRGHHGAIVSLVTVRYSEDLAYTATYQSLESRFANVRYLPLITRGPVGPKRYIQDLIRNEELADILPNHLDPSRTQVYLCGNPAMLGLPVWDSDQPTFPEPQGVCELLFERGFTLDRRGVIGNVHYEEYW